MSALLAVLSTPVDIVQPESHPLCPVVSRLRSTSAPFHASRCFSRCRQILVPPLPRFIPFARGATTFSGLVKILVKWKFYARRKIQRYVFNGDGRKPSEELLIFQRMNLVKGRLFRVSPSFRNSSQALNEGLRCEWILKVYFESTALKCFRSLRRKIDDEGCMKSFIRGTKVLSG